MSGHEPARELLRDGHRFVTLFVSGLALTAEALTDEAVRLLRTSDELGELNAALTRISASATA